MVESTGLRPAVFLDRDGTICEEVGYLNHLSRLMIFPWAAPAIRRLIEERLAQGDISELKRPTLPSSSGSTTRSSRGEVRAIARTTALWTL